jgi:hypothetical protein
VTVNLDQVVRFSSTVPFTLVEIPA